VYQAPTLLSMSVSLMDVPLYAPRDHGSVRADPVWQCATHPVTKNAELAGNSSSARCISWP